MKNMKKLLLPTLALSSLLSMSSFAIQCPAYLTCYNQTCTPTPSTSTFTSTKFLISPIPDGTYYFSYSWSNTSTSIALQGTCNYYSLKGEDSISLRTADKIKPDIHASGSYWERIGSDYYKYGCIVNRNFPYGGDPTHCLFYN